MTAALGIAVFVLSLIILIYLFLISPRLSNPADMELLCTDYAHRGLWNEKYPENSLPAFEMAARRGFGIELDLQLTKDGKIVVFHDDDLVRMCGVNRKVCQLTLEQIKALRLAGTPYTVPTFAEVLRLVGGRVPLLIEFKGDKPSDALCLTASQMLDTYRGAFCVESFSPLILHWFREHRPTFARGQLVSRIKKGSRPHSRKLDLLLSNMLTNFISRPDFIAISKEQRKSLAFLICTKAFHAKGFVWTVSSRQEYEAFKKNGHSTIFEKFLPKGNIKQ